MSGPPAGLAANPERYLTYVGWRSLAFWVPVFALWFGAHLPLGDVLRLEAVYYAAVVLLEVPTGWLSDRWGRRPVLLTGAVAGTLGCAVIAAGGALPSLALGQVLLATWMACNSGSDTSLLYDSLVALGRTEEHGTWEARAEARGLGAGALSAALGGLAAEIHLGAGHGLTALAGMGATFAAWRLTEPPHAADDSIHGDGVWGALRLTFVHPAQRTLLVAGAAMIVLQHVPYELGQPWLVAALGDVPLGAPATSGLLTAGAMGLAAGAAARVPRWRARVGPTALLLAALGGLVGLCAVLGVVAHPVLAPLLLMRSVPGAVFGPVLRHLAHPHLPSRLRATWFSILSLGGRAAFALSLWTVGSWSTEGPLPRLRLAAVCGLAVLMLLVRPVRRLTHATTG